MEKLFHKSLAVLGGLSICQAMRQGKFAIYTGVTKLDAKAEGWRFLTQRGLATRKGKRINGRNRPVLRRWPDKKLITQKYAIGSLRSKPINLEPTNHITNQMTQTFAGKCEMIYYSKLRINTRNVEDGLQAKIDAYPLGLRLHRARSTGGNLDKDDGEPDFLCKTFITVFPVSKAIKASIIGLNDVPIMIIR